MTASRVSALLGALAAIVGAAAMPATAPAADLGYDSVKDTPPPPPRRTWYLKGTLGMHNHSVGSIWDEVYANGFFTVHHTDMKTAPFYGLGVGVEHSRWLRFDLTGEYRGKFIFLGQDSYSNAGGGTNEYTADMESWVGLINAYIDICNLHGITPYVGAGVGIASMSVLGLKDVNVPQNSVFYGADNTEVNFAWALYAGMSYDVTPQFTVDLGYRYLDLGDTQSGRVTAYDGSSSYKALEIRDVVSHDLMLSMRYRLDRPVEYVPYK